MKTSAMQLMVWNLIEKGDFLPDSSYIENYSVSGEYNLLQGPLKNKWCIIELYDGDSIGDIRCSFSEKPEVNIDTGPFQCEEKHYIKVFVLEKEKDENDITEIKRVYQDVAGNFKNLSCIIFSLDRKFSLELGLFYPYHKVMEIVKIYGGRYNDDTGRDINKLICSRLDSKKSSIKDMGEEINNGVVNTLAYFFGVIWLVVLSLRLWSGAGIFIINDNFLTFLINMSAFIGVGGIIENNFGSRKFLVIMLSGGIVSGMPGLMFLSLSCWVMPLCGALLYLRHCVPDTFKLHKCVYWILISFLASIFLMAFFRGTFIPLTLFMGLPAGFLTAGIIGFEKEVKSYGGNYRKYFAGVFFASVALAIVCRLV